MKNTIGNEITLTLFGESHGPAIGCVLDGLPSGFRIDMERLADDMEKRKAAGSISTARKEADSVKIISGLKNGITEGTPLAILIENTNIHRTDYDDIRYLARPGHADYAAEKRYCGHQDASGGGHFSGRLTAPIVAAGSICRQMLETRGILIGSHILELHGVCDVSFENLEAEINKVNQQMFAVINDEVEERMKQEIEKARMNLDSVGGILETAVIGLEAGIGEPEFGSVESQLAAAMFSIPAVKGIEFGTGFGFKDIYGSEANDAFCMKDGKVMTVTNHNAGINGGITNGMPVVFRTVIKPTPSIARKQQTVDFRSLTDAEIEIHGRHDPAIIHRARIVQDSMTALVLADMFASAHGRQWLGEQI